MSLTLGSLVVSKSQGSVAARCFLLQDHDQLVELEPDAWLGVVGERTRVLL